MRIGRPEPAQPMPAYAKRVFKGVIFDVYQWEQKMFDGTTEVFEKLKRADTVVIVPITEEGKILLIDEEQPGVKSRSLALPAGRLEDGEEPEEAARRELLEETGYAARELVLWEARQPYDKIDWAVYLFVARGCKKAAEPELDAGERISVRLVSFEEFLERLRGSDPRGLEAVRRLTHDLISPEKRREMRRLFFTSAPARPTSD